MLRQGKVPKDADSATTCAPDQQQQQRQQQQGQHQLDPLDFSSQASLVHSAGKMDVLKRIPGAKSSTSDNGLFARLAWALKAVVLYVNNLFVRNKSFEALARRIFDGADVHKNGRIDEAETFVCILLIYDS